ncbi:DUF3800 domain-containing protein [Microbacterium invictum]|uniref:DUF3800 domain-containing protein n=1 Tax=Microbacterium invictum TaxID=515415 RepID=A0ABZ0V6F0_9MICO|nr:DUF3800 domain-containing protein [Microbacterium invictum]WQB69029.1 DUF3800 domain-containing protein [Microbacterium invictum]
MAVIYLYADETGNLDYAQHPTGNESGFFGFGTAMFRDEHGDAIWRGHELRTRLAAHGLQVPRGFHAKDDSVATRNEVFAVIRELSPRFDTTFLLKSNAYASVRDRGQMYLYKLAWFLHIKEVIRQTSNPNDRVIIIAGSFGTNERASRAREAIRDVCDQLNRRVTLCVWDASTSWGLQVADYGLWGTHRYLVGKGGAWFEESVRPSLQSTFTPWGR